MGKQAREKETRGWKGDRRKGDQIRGGEMSRRN